MPIDDRLSNALEHAAGSLPRTAGDWDDVRSAAVRRRHQRRTQAGVAIATVAAITLGVVFATGNSDDDHSIITAPPASAQVVATIDGRVVVLSGDDGEVLRTLSEGAPDLDATSITATPDGEAVYVQRGTECDGQVPPSIWRVPTSGGPATRIADVGIAPAVSPDGRWLAFATSTDEAPGDCGPFDRLEVIHIHGQNPDGSEAFSMDFTPAGHVAPVAWNADSSSLAVFVNEDSGGRGHRLIAVSDLGLTDSGPIAEPAANGLEFLPSGEVISAFPTEPTSRISTFDPETGAELDLVAEVSEPLYLIDVDRSGTSFLLEGPLADTPDGHDLYRAEVGTPDPVKLAEHVKDAVWLPSASRPSAEIAAAIGDKLVVLAADDGRTVRTLATAPSLRTIGPFSASPDGSDVYYSLIDSCDRPTEIWRVPSDGAGEPTRVALGGLPLVSPDGRWLAFAERLTLDHPCLYDVDLVVRDLTTGEEIRFPVAGGGFVEPLAWYPDSTKLVVQRMGSDIERPIDMTLEVLPSGLRELSAVINQVQSYEFLPSGEPVTANPLHSPTTSNIATFNPAAEDGIGYTVTEIDRAGFTDLVDVDSTGSKFLLFDGKSQAGLVHRDRNLFRADLGDPKPVKIAEHVNDAVWLSSPEMTPTTTSTTTSSAPTTQPDSLIALRGATELVELESTDGAERRLIASSLAFGEPISVNADRTQALVGYSGWSRCTSAVDPPGNLHGGVGIVDLATGDTQVVDAGAEVRGGYGAIWSPDARRFAFVRSHCDESDDLVVRGATGGDIVRFFTSRADWGSPIPLGWSADGQHLLVLVSNYNAEIDDERWLVDTSESGSIEERGVLVPPRVNLTDLKPLGATGRWVAVVGEGSATRLVELDVKQGIDTKTLLVWEDVDPTARVQVVATDESGQHLLLRTLVNGGSTRPLYRWSIGEAAPTKISDDVASADW